MKRCCNSVTSDGQDVSCGRKGIMMVGRRNAVPCYLAARPWTPRWLFAVLADIGNRRTFRVSGPFENVLCPSDTFVGSDSVKVLHWMSPFLCAKSNYLCRREAQRTEHLKHIFKTTWAHKGHEAVLIRHTAQVLLIALTMALFQSSVLINHHHVALDPNPKVGFRRH